MKTDSARLATDNYINVPLVDLALQHKEIRDEVMESIKDIIAKSAFIGGPYLAAFEDGFARFCGCRHAAGVSSGTSALRLALHCLGVGPGDEVITVPNTFIATAEAISSCGALPVFIDVEEETDTMDPRLIEDAITERTRAIIPVHLYGQPADLDPILEIARSRGLLVIEDACQAHGALYKGKPAGSLGDAGCFSFYPGKNMGAMGEAGAVVTNNKDLDHAVRVMRDHGQRTKYYHNVIGWNDRMDAIQAAVLSIKLRHINSWNQARRDKAALYTALLAGTSNLTLPKEAPYARHVYHIFAVGVPDRDECVRFMQSRGVGCGIHYPIPIHLQDAYRFLGLGQGSFPVAERRALEIMSLPVFPELSEEHIIYVAETLKGFLNCQ